METDIGRACRSLRELMGELSGKELARALRSAYRAEARRVKRTADRMIKGSGWSNAARLAKGVRAKARKDLRGFIVASNPRGRASMHLNSRGLLKPAAFWLDVGTDAKGERKTSSGKRRGATEGIRFTEEAEKEVPKSLGRLEGELRKQVGRIIERKMRNA